MTAKNPHLEELGQFLKARRGELGPTALGLPAGDPGTRRGSGLRREEVAARAAISHDHYSRIEQGRLAPSAPVLDALADTLRLTPVERTYVEGLARRADRRTAPRHRPAQIRPQIQRLLDRLTDTPAFVVGKYLDFLAWNPLAGALLIDLDEMAPHERNYVRMLFADPRMKDFYDDWEGVARTGVELLRMQAVDNPRDPRLANLVGELSVGHPLFRQWWAGRHVSRQTFGSKTIHHPELGEFTFDWDTFHWSGDPDQQLTIWSPAPGSSTEQKLRILNSWIRQSGTTENITARNAES
ncbi:MULTISPECIES: helix-turn-helix domain-containing protein [unclassified Streptomyces]|uniref:helix-turn-helix domain-containing protein n=1 Tax=unclassified Streptomyces TaxID=2593676 RepID=UPI000DD7C516|nr:MULTISPECIES: helix-turn-helix domain-containing protein [unclassified Streptomyces]QZZ25261.1 helix-turn-helix domain-containing protein [Streptomyces sp. ST1015]